MSKINRHPTKQQEEWGSLHTAEDVRQRYALPTDLSHLSLADLANIRQHLTNLLYEYSQLGTMPAPIARFLESEEYRVNKQMRVLEQQDKIRKLKGEVVTQVEDPDLRDDLSKRIDELAQVVSALPAQLQDRSADDRVRAELQARAEAEAAKWDRRKEMMQLDRVAVLVGALLLGMLALALISAMIWKMQIPEILSSAFLLILGFFFGQNSSRGGSSTDSN